VRACHRRMGSRCDGTLDRDPAWWDRRLAPDLAETMLYVVDGEDGLDGYAAYRHGTARAPYDYSVVVNEVIAEDPDVARALWRVVGSSGSQAPDVDVIGPSEDPLFLLLGAADPVAVRSEIRWMLRLVEAAGAIAARGWRPEVRGCVELAIADRYAPWNEGNWVLEVADGEGRLTPGGAGVVEATIGGLSSWWAGYASARRLAGAGWLRSADPAALDALDGFGLGPPPVLTDFY